MKKLFRPVQTLLFGFLAFFLLAAPSPHITHPPLIIEENDGSPSVRGTWKLKVTNGTLTQSGGIATLDVTGAGGGVGLGLSDPNADRIYFWDDGAGSNAFLAPGNSIAITGTTLDAIQDIRITAGPTFLFETLNRASLGITSTDGLVLINPTAAAAGAQQISPRLRWTGQGWKTDATVASRTVDWIAELVPVQGAANPQARLDFNYQINGAGYQATPTMSLLNGNVGINTINPTKLLHLSGSLPTIQLTSSTGFVDSWGFLNESTSGSLLVQSSNFGTVLNLTRGGNVGIGTITFGTSAVRNLALGAGTAPTTSPADVAQLWVQDINSVAGQAGFHIRDELGGTYKIGAGIAWASFAEPTCAAGIRGTVNYVAGGAGVLDTFKVCRKDAADVYAWVSLF
jgi:hypothetical protein